jgi:ferredoxin
MTVPADTRPLRRWLAAAAARTGVLVACREHEHIDAWRVPSDGTPQIIYRLDGCVADVPPAAFLEILAGGALGVTALLDGCADPAAARRVVTRASRLAALVAVGQPVKILTAPPLAEPALAEPGRVSRFRRGRPPLEREVLDARAMPVSRRALVGLDGALGDLDAHPGQRLFSVVRELLGGAPVPSELDDLPTGAGQLEAAQCCGSAVCVRTCPTQALRLTVTDLAAVDGASSANDALQQFALTFDPAQCIDCGQCVELCPESAMSRVGPLPWSQALNGMPMTLRVAMVRRCTRCGMPNDAAGSLCAVCAFRTSDPFGSALPPGFVRKSRT